MGVYLLQVALGADDLERVDEGEFRSDSLVLDGRRVLRRRYSAV